MINILYCGNLDMFDGIMLSLLSISKNTTTPFTAYIMSMDLRQINEKFLPFEKRHIDILDKVVKRDNPLNQVNLIDATEIFLEKLKDSPNMATGYTPYALLRLFCHKFDIPDQILYLDTDIMFLRDISLVQDEVKELHNYEFAAVLDKLGKRFIDKKYINTGVLYLNLAKIKETRLFERALEQCLIKQMPFPDQDALNELATSVLYIDEKFNHQSRKIKRDTVIQHFCKTIQFFPIFKVTNIKQWQIELVKKSLKIKAYDSIFGLFIEYREELAGDILPPLKVYKPMSFFAQLKYSFSELRACTKQNKGIFRKNNKK